jgi:acetoin utilization deacetylase AcuC-like enzyme
VLVVGAWPEEDRHDPGVGHPERPARVTAVLRGLERLHDAVVRLDARRATRQELERVHPADYLERLEAACARGGALDPDTVVSPGSYDTALLAAGGVLAAIDALEAEEGDVAFVATRPPGHHARPSHAMGFCLVNNVAVGAAELAARGNKVAIVDWDVHHGNGTQEIFWDDPRVLYASTHQWPLYPGTGRPEETGGPHAPGGVVNVPVPPGATGDVLLEALERVIGPAVADFEPDWVLVSAGFDAHRADPLANLELTAGDFAQLSARVVELAPRRGRVVVALEGGYDLDALASCVAATLTAALGAPLVTERPSFGGPGREAVERARQVIKERGSFRTARR